MVALKYSGYKNNVVSLSTWIDEVGIFCYGGICQEGKKSTGKTASGQYGVL